MAKIKVRNGRKIKKAVFNIGPILLLIAAAVAIFMIGRAIGKKERYYPIVRNDYTRSLGREHDAEMIRQRLLDLQQI